MRDNSKIEWTDATWNPVRGCTKISGQTIEEFIRSAALEDAGE
ncbi:MAG: phage Gp37/Gp68 family protein [Akkermansia muciniphila]